ncbi:MAG: energy transducer TonB [Bacteroidota bacterium]|nr:energy transducer TonB [Bacteroidota bacterium]
MTTIFKIVFLTITINAQSDSTNCEGLYEYFHSITENELIWLWETPPQCLNRDSISSFIVYPVKALKDGIEGTVILELIIERNGKPRCPKILRSIHEDIDNEALRLVKYLDFAPALQGNEPVMSFITLPIEFNSKENRQFKKCRKGKSMDR